MMASIFAFVKAICEILGIAEYFYKQTKKTEIQKEQDIDASIQAEEDRAKKEGRPTWE